MKIFLRYLLTLVRKVVVLSKFLSTSRQKLEICVEKVSILSTFKAKVGVSRDLLLFCEMRSGLFIL